MMRVPDVWRVGMLVLSLAGCDALKAFLPEQLQDKKDAGPPAGWVVHTPFPDVDNWFGVWAPRHDVAYFVGSHGRIAKWADGEFTAVSSGTTENLQSVWGRAPDDIFAVGEHGVILHSSGADFTPMQVPGPDGGMVNPSSFNLFAVFGDRDAVYMVGERGDIFTQDADGGLRSMYDEATISTYPICETRVLDVTEPVDVCTTQGIPHSGPDGGVVRGPDTYPSCGTPMECCAFTNTGGGTYCCYPQRCDADGGPLIGRLGVDADLKAGWAQGDYAVACGAGGAIYELMDGAQGRKWYRAELAENVPFTRDALAAAWGVGSNVFCAGQDGRLMHKRNGVWNPESIPTPAFVQGMWGTGGRDVYAVGFSGVDLRYDGYPLHDGGVGWYAESVRVQEHLRTVTGVRLDFDGGQETPASGPPPARIFVGGSNGKILIKN